MRLLDHCPRLHKPLRVTALVLVAVLCHPARAENWPAWRGPLGTGICDDKQPPLAWDAKRNVRWRVALPDRGNSTPVVWGDRVFVTQALEKERRRTVMCFSKTEGKLLWQSGVTCDEQEPSNGLNPYCSGSPVTDGQHVVAYFGSPGLVCYDLNGKELWRRPLGKVDSWQGSGSSPVLWGELCILNFGPGSEAALVACDKKTGAIVWRVAPPKPQKLSFGWAGFGPTGAGPENPASPETKPQQPAPSPPPPKHDFGDAMWAADSRGRGGFMGSWSTPLVVHAADHDELIVVHPIEVVAYDPATGKRLWSCGGVPDQAFASPAVGEGTLVAAGHLMSGGTQITAIKLGGRGDVTETHRLWQTKLPKECIGSPVIVSGHAFFVTDFGTVVCLDLRSGKKLAEKRLTGQGSRSGSWSSLVLAGGKLLVTNLSGEVFVLEPSPHLNVLALNSIGEETTCASAALSDGLLYLRTYNTLWCIGNSSQ